MNRYIFKIFTALTILILIYSCSNDNEGPQSTSPVLIKKITDLVEGEAPYVSTFIYDGNTLSSINFGASSLEFDYNGEKIVEARSYENGALTLTNSFVYSGDKLTKVESDGVYAERSLYFYTGDKLNQIRNEYLSGSDWILMNTRNITFNDDANIVQVNWSSNFGGTTYSFRTEYSYDQKHNPMRDMNPYVRLILEYGSFDAMTANNIVSEEAFSSGNVSQGIQSSVITYNAGDFPTQIIKQHPNGGVSSQASIEYQ